MEGLNTFKMADGGRVCAVAGRPSLHSVFFSQQLFPSFVRYSRLHIRLVYHFVCPIRNFKACVLAIFQNSEQVSHLNTNTLGSLHEGGNRHKRVNAYIHFF